MRTRSGGDHPFISPASRIPRHVVFLGIALLLGGDAFARDSYQQYQADRAHEAWREKAFFTPNVNPRQSRSTSTPTATPPPRYHYTETPAERASRPPKRTGNMDVDRTNYIAWMTATGQLGSSSSTPTPPRPAPPPPPPDPRDSGFRAQAEAGEPKSMWAYGRHLMRSDSPVLQAEGWQMILGSAAKHNIAAIESCIEIYTEGKYVPQDLLKAREWWVELAETGNFDAQVRMGEELLVGDQGPADPVRAEKFLTHVMLDQDVALGHALWSYRAGMLLVHAYQSGLVLPKDEAKAFQVLRTMYHHPDSTYYHHPAIVEAMMPYLMATPDDARANAAELVQMWDKTVPQGTHAMALRAGEAVDSGITGKVDPLRAILYLSFAVSPTTDIEDPQKVAEVRSRVADLVIAMQKTEPPQIAFNYKPEPAPPQLPRVFYAVAARDAVKPWAHPFLMAGYLSLEDQPDDPECSAKAAYDLFDAGAKKTDAALAWYESARILATGAKDVERDPAEAYARFAKASARGEDRATCRMAMMQFDGVVPEAAPEKGLTILRQLAATNAQIVAIVGTNRAAQAGDDAVKLAEAGQWLQIAAEQGNGLALYSLGALAERRGAKDPVEFQHAAAYYEQAIAAGYNQAHAGLAYLMAAGRGVEKNLPEALTHLRLAAETYQSAAANLGVILWRGEWGETNVSEGLRYMDESLAQGSWVSGRNLAKIHHLGLGIEKDEAAARQYLERAGAIDPDAAKAIAELYRKGEVITADPEAAARWEQTCLQVAQVDSSAMRRELLASVP